MQVTVGEVVLFPKLQVGQHLISFEAVHNWMNLRLFFFFLAS